MKSVIYSVLTVLLLVLASPSSYAQGNRYTLEQITAETLKNNSLLKIQKKNVEEKQAQIREAEVKFLPTLVAETDYSHHFNVGQLAIPAGAIDPDIPIPSSKLELPAGKKNHFTTGISLYQPLTQLAKISTAVEIEKVEKSISEIEAKKLSSNLSLEVEKLYYAILSVQKRIDASRKKIKVAQILLYDAQVAVNSGKTILLNETALSANLYKEQQELLKLQIREQDFLSDLQGLSGIKTSSIVLEDPANAASLEPHLDPTLKEGPVRNYDNQISELHLDKLRLAIRATNESFIPEVGLVAGYSYQEGHLLLPKNDPFIGVHFKWDLQEVLSNTHALDKRKIQYEQVKEHHEYTQKHIRIEIEKADRKLSQSKELIGLALQAYEYRVKDFELETNRSSAGLNQPIDVLRSDFMLSEAKADLYDAKLNYRISCAEIINLTNPK